VSGVADEHGLPASLIAPRASLDRIARELPPTVEGIAAELDGGHWRAELVAAPIYDLLSGKTALAVLGAAQGNPHIERVSTAAE
jgi:hypothetical protein